MDTVPEFVLRANCCLVLTSCNDRLAILREVAFQDVTEVCIPTFDELIIFTIMMKERVASHEGVLPAIALCIWTIKVAVYPYVVKMSHQRIVCPDQLDD